MKNAPKVYIASPYTLGDIGVNVKTQHDVFYILLQMGYNPHAPLLLHYQHIHHPLSYQTCIDYTLSWLEVCDILLRLPGESAGADGEVARAKELGMPVYYDYRDLPDARSTF
jgi:hypothetical protein